MLMGEMLSIPEAFVALGNSGVILLIIPIFLVLMADFLGTGIDRFYPNSLYKEDMDIWTGSFCGSGILFCAFIPFGVIVRSYDRDRQMESFISDAVTHFTSVYPDRTEIMWCSFFLEIYQQMTLEQHLYTFCLLYIFCSYHMCCFFRLSAITDMWGYSVNGFAIILGAVTCEVRMKQMWILPMAHTIPWLHYDEYLDRMNFPMWGSYLYLAAISALLLVLCFARAGRYQVKE